MAVTTVKVQRGWLALFCLWVALGVSLAPYRPATYMGAVPARAPTAHHAGHAHSQEPEPTGTHHHDPRCVLCVVGAGTLPALVRVPKVVRLERTELPLLLLDARPRTFRLFRSRAPPLQTSFQSAFRF